MIAIFFGHRSSQKRKIFVAPSKSTTYRPTSIANNTLQKDDRHRPASEAKLATKRANSLKSTVQVIAQKPTSKRRAGSSKAAQSKKIPCNLADFSFGFSSSELKQVDVRNFAQSKITGEFLKFYELLNYVRQKAA